MSAKEISVFIIGLMLIIFLYNMKHPSETQISTVDLLPNQDNKTNALTEQQQNFDPTTSNPTLENILDIPAWTFDLATIEALTSEELVKSIQLAIEEDRYFQPANNNALFFLLNLKTIDENNSHIQELTTDIKDKIALLAQQAIEGNNDTSLTDIISRLKTLSFDKDNIKFLEEQLATIKTVNKLYSTGIAHIESDDIVNESSSDAWHIAKQLLEIDPSNVKSIDLINQVNNRLINNALRAAEEIDFQLAYTQINQAALLSPESQVVILAQQKIDALKQKRFEWLQQQISIAISNLNVQRSERLINQLAELGIERSLQKAYQNELNRITLYGKYQPLDTFSDKNQAGQEFPTMVVMPVGKYLMGSNTDANNQEPVHQVNINYGFAVSQNEISVEQFKLFIDESNYKTDAEINKSSRIYDMRTGRLKNKNRITWQRDYMGKKANAKDPVIHVSWNDAQAYTQWLSKQTGKNYRLLSEAEFEYVLRAGSTGYYPWGEGTPSQVIENLTGKLDNAKDVPRAKWKKGIEKYNDKYWGPAPVGSFIPNAFNLNDTAGNVMEWVMDCWHDSYARAPIDGSSWSNPGCEDHVIRGGSWSSAVNEYASAHRFTAKANFTDARLGFRIAVNLK